MSVMDMEKLNIQTTWNMEMPYEMMLGLKKQVPAVMDMVSNSAFITMEEVNRQVRNLEGSFKQGKVMFKRAVANIAEVNPSAVMTTVTDNAILFLREFQKRVEIVLDVFVECLRYQIPGYDRMLSGHEVYQEFSAFVADVTEEAIEKIPKYFASIFADTIKYFEAIEFTFPGSGSVISGREIIDDLMTFMRKIQGKVIVQVRQLKNIQLDDIVQKFTAIMHFTIEQSEKFLDTLKSQNVERLSTFVTDVYNDAMNSRFLADVAKQIEDVHRIIIEYLKVVTAKAQSLLADMSSEQLKADIQSWIDSMVKRMNAFHNNVIRTLQEKSKAVEPYVRVSDRQMEVDIPLPFVARFN